MANTTTETKNTIEALDALFSSVEIGNNKLRAALNNDKEVRGHHDGIFFILHK